MALAIQIFYPAGDGVSFDYDYFLNSHMKLVGQHWGKHLQSSVLVRGIASGPNTPPAFSMVATMIVADQVALDALLADRAEVDADVANYTNAVPQILIGEVIA